MLYFSISRVCRSLGRGMTKQKVRQLPSVWYLVYLLACAIITDIVMHPVTFMYGERYACLMGFTPVSNPIK